MCEQFRDDYDGNNLSNTDLKEVLGALSKSRMSDDEILSILRYIVSQKRKQPATSNSQFGDH